MKVTVEIPKKLFAIFAKVREDEPIEQRLLELLINDIDTDLQENVAVVRKFGLTEDVYYEDQLMALAGIAHPDPDAPVPGDDERIIASPGRSA